MFRVTQLSDVPYMGAPHSDWYIQYEQRTKVVTVDNVVVTTKVAFDILNDIKKQLSFPPERGHHYDVSYIGNVVRIGICGHGISVSEWDLPLFKQGD